MDEHEQDSTSSARVAVGLFLIFFAAIAYAVYFIIFGPGIHCVVEGTPIDTPDGPCLIEALNVGDAVWTSAPDGRREIGRVVAVRSFRADEYRVLRTRAGNELQVTTTHPVATRSGWMLAGKLSTGTRVRTVDGLQEVVSTRTIRRTVRVYDLTVQPNANFFAGGLLVHNKTWISAEKIRLRRLIVDLEVAIRRFREDYNQLPWPVAAPPSGEPIQDILRELAPSNSHLAGKMPSINVKKDYFIAPKKFSRASIDGKEVLVDRWRNEIRIRYDPKTKTVTLWSFGPDGIDQTGDGDDDTLDDIVHRFSLP